MYSGVSGTLLESPQATWLQAEAQETQNGKLLHACHTFAGNLNLCFICLRVGFVDHSFPSDSVPLLCISGKSIFPSAF